MNPIRVPKPTIWAAQFQTRSPEFCNFYRMVPGAHRWVPPALASPQQAELKAAVQAPPSAVGIELADWNWKVVRAFVQRRFGSTLSRSSCLNYLHRLGFVLKRPKKRLVKADAARRAVFVREYVLLRAVAHLSGAKLFCVARLSALMRNPAWESTNNAAERGGRAFRHGQHPHFRLRRK